MKPYTIIKGRFVDRDEKGQPVTRQAGEQIDLEDDVAAAHADKLEPVQTPAPASDGDA